MPPTMEIVYRADRLEHIGALATLHHAEWGHLSPHIDLNARMALLREAAGRGEVPTVVLAVRGSQLAGSAALVASDLKERAALWPWLAAVYVRAEHRNQGVATALVSRIEQEAAALRINSLYLFTEHEEAFYARRGWVVLERMDYRGTAVSVMSKELSPALRVD